VASYNVVLACVQVHVGGTSRPRVLERGLHQRATDALPAPVRHDVKLREVALEPIGVHERTEPQERESGWAGIGDQD